MLINSGEFLTALQEVRTCWFMGAVSSYKTALAVYLATSVDYMRRLRCFSTIPYIYASSRAEYEKPLVNRFGMDAVHGVFLLDEGGRFIDDELGKILFDYPAKLNIYLLLPSISPPPKMLQSFYVQKVFSTVLAGLPLVVYRWGYDYGSVKRKGYFGWYDPLRDVRGLYSRQNVSRIPTAEAVLVAKAVKLLTQRQSADTVKKAVAEWI